MIKRFVVIVALLGIVLTASAQEGTSSPYSFYGIGLTKFRGTAEQRGMAGLGAYSDSIHINLHNPASFAKLRLTAYSVGASHQSLSLEDANASESASHTTFDYLALGFPAGRLGFGLSVYPSTTVGYNIKPDNGESLSSSDQFTGRGGLNKVALSTAYKVTDNFNIGVDFQYNFGNIQNKSIRFQDDIQFGTREINRSDFLGFSFKVGAIYDTKLTENLDLTATATYMPSTTINVENFRELATVIVGNSGQELVADRQDIELEDSDFKNPSEISLGLGIGKANKWYAGLEYVNSQKSNFNNRSFNNEDVIFDDASKFKVGGFYIPKYNDLTSYLNRIVYRLGARYEETGLNLRGEDINEFGISFGVGIPAGRLFTNANLSFEYGQRGTTDAGLIKESFYNIIIGLSLNDKWFEKTKFN
tara:strand:- start:1899 stop:3152 length:1254 start_codon:yes stop_codon:yes gene_type:complete